MRPPTPRLTAQFKSHRFYWQVLMPPEAVSCTVTVAAFSSADPTNRAGLPRDAPQGFDIKPAGGRAAGLLLEPAAVLPPYEVIAVASAPSGRMSETAKVRLPYPGDYCLRHRPKDACVWEARILARRCALGDAPKNQCLPWVYGRSRPASPTPVKGASFTAIVASIQRRLARELLVQSPSNKTRLAHLTCTQALVCTATYKRDPGEGQVRYRYQITGHNEPAGCWYTTRGDRIEPPETEPPTPIVRSIMFSRVAGCTNE